MATEEVLNVEEVSPLCIRIKNAFTMDEISLIHSTYQIGIQPVIDITPNSRLQVEFDGNYIDCEALGCFTIYNDEKKEEKDEKDKEDLLQIKISESEYSIKNGISNIVCFVPMDRFDQNDLKQNHSKILCKTEHRNFGVLYPDNNKTNNGKTPNCKVNGHIVTYLDAVFTRYAKNVYNKMLNFCKFADKRMEWELLNDDSWRTKCIEYIEYIGKGSNLGWHCDMGSLITIVIMLSHSNEYKGGTFQCKKLVKINDDKYIEKEDRINVSLQCGDIAVFSSDKCNHRVTDIINGRRNVLVMELIFW